MTRTYSEIVRPLDEAAEILRRTKAITDRLLPPERAPHGWYQRDAFFNPARKERRLNWMRLYNAILPRVRAKVVERDWWSRTPMAERARQIDAQPLSPAVTANDAAIDRMCLNLLAGAPSLAGVAEDYDRALRVERQLMASQERSA